MAPLRAGVKIFFSTAQAVPSSDDGGIVATSPSGIVILLRLPRKSKRAMVQAMGAT